VEISRSFVAICQPSRDVYYFGEEVDIYEEGRIVSHDGPGSPAGVGPNRGSSCTMLHSCSGHGPLEPGSVSTKVYCPGKGLVRDGELELIAIFSNASPPTVE
jgi:hypothetical protein